MCTKISEMVRNSDGESTH